jgi:photosystem II stability/assembly factor-like uncharacterized protein
VNESDAALIAISGNRRVWISQDGGENFNSAMKGSVMGGGSNTVHWAEADQAKLYACSKTGYVHYSIDYGETWTKSTTKIGVASNIDTHPLDANKVYAAIQGYGTAHFYMSTDHGVTWTAPATNLPDISSLSIAVSSEGVIFLGHQFGVMVSQDNGVTWEPLREGLPLVQIMSLSIRGSGDNMHLIAGTYGRGAYRINISELKLQTKGVEDHSVVNTFAKLSTNVIEQSKAQVALTVSLDGGAMMNATLYDYLGREVKTLHNGNITGESRVQLDLSNVSAGKYFVVVTAKGKSNSLPVTIL